MHIQDDVEILLVRPLNDVVKQSKSFGIVTLKKLVVQRDSYRIETVLLDEMDVRLGDVVFAIAAPEVMRSLRSDELSDKSFNLARRFRPTIIQVPHVAFRNQPVAKVCPTKQQRLSCAIDDLFSLGMGELSLRPYRGDTTNEKSGNDRSAEHWEIPRLTCSAIDKRLSMKRYDTSNRSERRKKKALTRESQRGG